MKKPLNLAERVLGKEGFEKSKTAQFPDFFNQDFRCITSTNPDMRRSNAGFVRTHPGTGDNCAISQGRIMGWHDLDSKRNRLRHSTPEVFKYKSYGYYLGMELKEKLRNNFQYWLDVAIDIYSKPLY